jgi:hypothetical protein
MEVYAMNPILWKYMLKLENCNIHKSSRTNVNKMARRFVSQSITCEIISFAVILDNNAYVVKDSLIDIDEFKVHMDSIPLLIWFCVAQL